MDFGSAFWLRNTFNVSFLLAIYSAVCGVALLAIFNLIKVELTPTMYVFFFDFAMIIIPITKQILLGAEINYHAQVHKNLLQKQVMLWRDI